MAEAGVEKRVMVRDDPATLASSVANRLIARLRKAGEHGRISHLALTGGTIGTEVLRRAGAHPDRNDVDWSLVHFWWGDERFVPRDDDERNELGAHHALIDRVGVPPENVHPIASSDEGLTLDEAADAYSAELARFAEPGALAPAFTVCFLGVGPDGHIASLFPDRAEIRILDRGAVPVRDAPKPPPERISLTRPVINASERVYLVLAGADKAAALGLALAGASYDSVPAAGAKGTKRTLFFVDQAAASEVPEELIDRDL